MNNIQRLNILREKLHSLEEKKVFLEEQIEVCTQKEILLMQEFTDKVNKKNLYKRGGVSMSEDLFKALRKALKV